MKRLLPIVLVALAAISCSTTRRLEEGQIRLADNRIEILNDEKFKGAELAPYIKQKPASWTPGIYVYNWSGGKGTKWDKFVEKLGQAPVVYDSTLVMPSVRSMLNHLDYIGRYNSSIDTSIHIKKRNAIVSYRVNLGEGYVVDSISYLIPDAGMDSIFMADTDKPIISKGDILSQEALEDESERLESLYRDNGFRFLQEQHLFLRRHFPRSRTLRSGCQNGEFHPQSGGYFKCAASPPI